MESASRDDTYKLPALDHREMTKTELIHCPQRVDSYGRVLINRRPNADLDVPLNVRYWGKADMARTCHSVR